MNNYMSIIQSRLIQTDGALLVFRITFVLSNKSVYNLDPDPSHYQGSGRP